jgi:hypothetical protein
MANGDSRVPSRAAQRREGVGDEALGDLVGEFRTQRRARNLRALGSGMQGLGRTLRGREADIDQAFIQGGLEGEDAWMTAEEKRVELRDLELQMRQEQLQRDQMELQQRTALLSFMDSAMSRKLSREEGRLNREQERAIANARMRIQAAQTHSSRRTERRASMDDMAAQAAANVESMQGIAVLDRNNDASYYTSLAEQGLILAENTQQFQDGDIFNAPVVDAEAVRERLAAGSGDSQTGIGAFPAGTTMADASDEQLQLAVDEVLASEEMGGGTTYKTDRMQSVATEQRAGAARNRTERLLAEQDFTEAAINEAIRSHGGNVPAGASEPADHLSPVERVELEMSLARQGIPASIASSGGAVSDFELWQQDGERGRATASSAGVGVAQVATAAPEVFDPTEVAQIQEAARMLGYTVRSDAQGAIQAAQESAGREGVTETQEVAQAGQQAQQPAEQSWLGIPGLERPSDPREESLQAMEMIAEMPELPPLQHARQQLVQSPQFLQYQQDRGYTDERETIRQMVKESRQQDRQGARDTRAAARENRQLGIVPEAPEEMARRREEENEPREPDAPVEGAI